MDSIDTHRWRPLIDSIVGLPTGPVRVCRINKERESGRTTELAVADGTTDPGRGGTPVCE
ncbi:MAG: hypothetical protein DRJ50_11695 [Actinobacteria bacterium]|nr:MAG: hypothetical protein DRJ50_11695 [Actinomycetota bacterium]